MNELPTASVYEQEFEFFPWGKLIEEVLDHICQHAPQNGKILDLMCGPGYLLGKIQESRPDLELFGVDMNEEFINHAQQQYQNITFETADILKWKTSNTFDLVVCTAGVHHLQYHEQGPFVSKIPLLLADKGKAIFADPLTEDYSTESERKQAAAKLGYEYLLATIQKKAPEDIIKAAIDIMYNDVMGFEYKTSLDKMHNILKKTFSKVSTRKVWPKTESTYGDYYFVCA